MKIKFYFFYIHCVFCSIDAVNSNQLWLINKKLINRLIKKKDRSAIISKKISAIQHNSWLIDLISEKNISLLLKQLLKKIAFTMKNWLEIRRLMINNNLLSILYSSAFRLNMAQTWIKLGNISQNNYCT